MVPFLLLSLAQMSLKQRGSSWRLGHTMWAGWVGSSHLSSSALPDPSFSARKGTENPFLCSHLPAKKPCSRLGLAGTKWLERMGWGGIVSKPSAGLGRTPLLRGLLGREGMMYYFLWSKVHSGFIGCLCFNGFCLVGKPECHSCFWCHTALQWHSHPQEGGTALKLCGHWRKLKAGEPFKIVSLCGSWKWRCSGLWKQQLSEKCAWRDYCAVDGGDRGCAGPCQRDLMGAV